MKPTVYVTLYHCPMLDGFAGASAEHPICKEDFTFGGYTELPDGGRLYDRLQASDEPLAAVAWITEQLQAKAKQAPGINDVLRIKRMVDSAPTFWQLREALAPEALRLETIKVRYNMLTPSVHLDATRIVGGTVDIQLKDIGRLFDNNPAMGVFVECDAVDDYVQVTRSSILRVAQESPTRIVRARVTPESDAVDVTRKRHTGRGEIIICRAEG